MGHMTTSHALRGQNGCRNAHDLSNVCPFNFFFFNVTAVKKKQLDVLSGELPSVQAKYYQAEVPFFFRLFLSLSCRSQTTRSDGPKGLNKIS